MLYFLYHGNYEEGISKPDRLVSSVFHAKIYLIAEKYHIEGLSDLALEKYKASLPTQGESDDFAEAIAEVYTNTTSADHKLRLAIQSVAKSNASTLFANNDDHALFRLIASETPAFAAELVQAIVLAPACVCRSQATRCPRPTYHNQDYYREDTPALGDARDVSTNEPDELIYVCPRCGVPFRARFWAHGMYRHACSEVLSRRETVSNRCSGSEWLSHRYSHV